MNRKYHIRELIQITQAAPGWRALYASHETRGEIYSTPVVAWGLQIEHDPEFMCASDTHYPFHTTEHPCRPNVCFRYGVPLVISETHSLDSACDDYNLIAVIAPEEISADYKSLAETWFDDRQKEKQRKLQKPG